MTTRNRPTDDDAWLDEQLREVALPTNWRARWRQVAALTEEELDQGLRDVPIPAGWLACLKAIPGRRWLPAWRTGPARLRFSREPRFAGQRPRRRWADRLAIAAAVLLLLSSSALWSSVGLLSIAESISAWGPGAASPEPLIATMDEPPAPPSDSPWLVSISSPGRVSTPQLLAQELRRQEETFAGGLSMPIRPAKESVSRAPTTLAEIVSAAAPRVDAPQFQTALLREPRFEGIRFAAHESAERTPGSASQAPLASGRAAIGRVSVTDADLALRRGDQQAFLSRVGLYPPVLAADRPSVSLGLSFGSGGWDVAGAYLARGEWPPAEVVRTEDLLVALSRGAVSPPVPVKPAASSAPPGKTSPDRPPSTPAFALEISGGPSPFSAENRLLHIGLRGRDLPSAAHRPLHLTVAVDRSAAMDLGGRLALVRRALVDLPAQLGPQDRLSLVRFGDNAEVVAERLGRDDRADWRRAVEQLQPSGESGQPAIGVARGLTQLLERQPPRGVTSRLLVVTHGAQGWDEPVSERLRFQADEARQEGHTIGVLAVLPVAPIHPAWHALVKTGGGRLDRAAHVAQLRGQLLESLTGRSQILLHHARLSVRFPATQVVSFRLLGHEPSVAAEIERSQVESHLYAGQATSVAFEIRPLPGISAAGQPDQEIATVTLEWRHPTTGEAVQTSRRLLRSQLKPTFAEAAPNWQSLTLVAAMAEVLRGSPFAQQITLAEIAERARALSSARSQNPEFQEFLGFVEQAAALAPRGGGSRSDRTR